MLKHSRIKSITLTIAIIFIVVIAIIIFCFLFPTKTKDCAYLSNVTATTEEHRKIKQQFETFQSSGSVFLYEYTDTFSYSETLVYYYFMLDDGTNSQWQTVEKEVLAYLNTCLCTDETIDELINVIYYYSLIIEKFTLSVSDDFEEILKKADLYLSSQTEKDIITVNNYRKLYEACRSTKSSVSLNSWSFYSHSAVIADEKSIRLSYSAIDAVLSNDPKKISSSLDDILIAFENSSIDIEELIIYLNLFPPQYILDCNREYISLIFDFCDSNRYSLSAYTCFTGFKLCETFDSVTYTPYIKNIYNNTPKSSDGLVPAVAQIIPSYRRIFHFTEVCSAYDINIDKACLYEIIQNINDSNLSAEDYYYMTLLSADYQYIEVDTSKLSLLVTSSINTEISLSNYYNFYYLCKAAMLNNIDCSDLIDKMDAFYATISEKNIIIDIWNEELSLLNGAKSSNIVNIQTEILNINNDTAIEIDIYYHYALLVKNSKIECSKEVKDKIFEAIEKHYTEYGNHGGYWLNSQMKYIDISQTYKCLYLSFFTEE